MKIELSSPEAAHGPTLNRNASELSSIKIPSPSTRSSAIYGTADCKTIACSSEGLHTRVEAQLIARRKIWPRN
jgi:hypothetical protein